MLCVMLSLPGLAFLLKRLRPIASQDRHGESLIFKAILCPLSVLSIRPGEVVDDDIEYVMLTSCMPPRDSLPSFVRRSRFSSLYSELSMRHSGGFSPPPQTYKDMHVLRTKLCNKKNVWWCFEASTRLEERAAADSITWCIPPGQAQIIEAQSPTKIHIRTQKWP